MKEKEEKTTFESIEEAVKELGLSKRVRWKNYLGYLCRYTKKSICPECVVRNGIPVSITTPSPRSDKPSQF